MADFGDYSLPEGSDYTVPPLLKDIDFWYWKIGMTLFIQSSDFDMWNVVTNVFDFKPRKDWTEKEKKMFSLNIRAMKILYSGLTENDYEKIKFCSSAKDIWDTLDSIYASNNCVEVDNVDSSSETISCISMIDEQLEVENEEGEILEHFHDLVSKEEQEEDDSQKELSLNEMDDLLSEAQDMVNDSNSSCEFKEKDFEKLRKTVFKSTTGSIVKNENVFNHAGKSCGKKEFTNMSLLILPPLNQHNTCKRVHDKHHSIICNHCGRSGHISHTCYIRRNSNVRKKYIWVPKGQVRSNTNNQGPKYTWVPKCPSSALCVQSDLESNGHNGTKKRKRNPRVSHEIKRRFTSTKRTRGDTITTISSSNQKKQWIPASRGVCSTSRINYHRVAFNYLEENMKRRISQISNRRLLKSISFERTLQIPTGTHDKNQCDRKRQWVSKVDPPST